MSRMRDVQSKKRGAALALALFVVVILLVTGAGLLRLGLQARVYAARTSDEIAARTAADAGLERALAEMNAALNAGESDSSSLSKPKEEQLLPNSDATYTYKIVANSINSNRDFNITCTGKSGSAVKVVYATVRVKGLFDYGIFSKGLLSLKADTLIDGYNSQDPSDDDVGLEIATISTSPGQIILNSGVVIDGDVGVGVGGDPATVIKDLGGTTGNRYALQQEPDFPDITPPVLPDMGGEIYVKGNILNINPAANGKYTAINVLLAGTKKEPLPATLIVSDGDVVLHVTGDVLVGEQCEIIVNANASLTLYVDGNIICRANSNIGYEGAPQNPKHMQIFGTSSGPQTFDLKAKSFWSGVVYAPNADIDLFALGDIYGSFVGDSFELKAGGNFYYDEALQNAEPGDEGASFVIVKWWE